MSQFLSVHFKMVSMRSEKPIIMRSISSLQLKFPQRCLWNQTNVRLIDDGPLSSFQGRSSSASSFHTSLLETIDVVMSLAWPQCLKLLNTSRIFGREDQTASTGLRHPSSKHSHGWLRRRSHKTVSQRTVFLWCSNGSNFVTNNSNYIRRFFYNWPRCLRQYK